MDAVHTAGMSVVDKSVILGTIVAMLGILAAVWIAALTFFRTETRGKIDRVSDQLEHLQNLMASTWGMVSAPAAMPNLEMRLLEARLVNAAELLEAVTTRAAIKTRSTRPGGIGDAVVAILDAATNHIENRSTEVAYKRLERCHAVLGQSSRIVDILESDFERLPRKLLFW